MEAAFYPIIAALVAVVVAYRLIEDL